MGHKELQYPMCFNYVETDFWNVDNPHVSD